MREGETRSVRDAALRGAVLGAAVVLLAFPASCRGGTDSGIAPPLEAGSAAPMLGAPEAGEISPEAGAMEAGFADGAVADGSADGAFGGDAADAADGGDAGDASLEGTTVLPFLMRAGKDNHPTSFVIGDVEHVFWCGTPMTGFDHIYYQSRQLVSPYTQSDPMVVLSPSGVAGAFDKTHVCDPNVVAGAFELDGQNYAYAMYYTGARACAAGDAGGDAGGLAGCVAVGTGYVTPANIGVVYSNTLTEWFGQKSAYNPIMPLSCTTNAIGNWPPSAWAFEGATPASPSGIADVRLFWNDACTNWPIGAGVTAVFAGGRTMKAPPVALPPVPVTPGPTNDCPAPANQPPRTIPNTLDWAFNDFAVRDDLARLYMLAPSDVCSRYRLKDFGIYSIPLSDMVSPTGTWRQEYQLTASDYAALFDLPADVGLTRSQWGVLDPTRRSFGGGFELLISGGPNDAQFAAGLDLYAVRFGMP